MHVLCVMRLIGHAYARPTVCFADASKSVTKLDLMTIHAEDILASRVFQEGNLDMDGDEGADADFDDTPKH